VQPVRADVGDVGEEIQFSATELRGAIEYLRERDADLRPFDLTQLWEHEPDDALAEALDQLRSAA
jgi:hypothetical protein